MSADTQTLMELRNRVTLAITILNSIIDTPVGTPLPTLVLLHSVLQEALNDTAPGREGGK